MSAVDLRQVSASLGSVLHGLAQVSRDGRQECVDSRWVKRRDLAAPTCYCCVDHAGAGPAGSSPGGAVQLRPEDVVDGPMIATPDR